MNLEEGESVESFLADEMGRLKCTGAETQPVLSSAQLSAVKRHLKGKAEEGNSQSQDEELTSADIPVSLANLPFPSPIP